MSYNCLGCNGNKLIDKSITLQYKTMPTAAFTIKAKYSR
jgi:hypothetical protein